MVQNVHFSRYFVKSSGSADTREMHEIGISGCAGPTVHISVFRGAQCTIAPGREMCTVGYSGARHLGYSARVWVQGPMGSVYPTAVLDFVF
jgi:hypothetical protein